MMRNFVGIIGLFRGGLSQAASNELLARRPTRAKVMKTLILAISAISLANVASASAQVPAEKNTIHQSAGDRDSRGTPKYYARSHSRTHYRGRAMKHDPSIHQSAGDRDSRGTPKN
jgi:hypothetical protein